MSVLRLTPEHYAVLQKKAGKPAQMAPGRPFPASGVLPRTKYHNRATGGYSSVKESRRAAELKLLEKAGLIRNLREQVPFILIPAQYDANRKLIERQCVYVADFVYDEAHEEDPNDVDDLGWIHVVEDVKSEATKTESYVIKRKLMLMVLRIRLREV